MRARSDYYHVHRSEGNNVAEETLTVGNPIIIPQDSPNGRYSAFFEDEGETGYFYAVDFSRSADSIVDAVHIYSVADVLDRDKPSQVKIVWSDDGMKCALLINDYPHATFNFGLRRGYCRTNFPNFDNPKDGSWIKSDHAWSGDAVSWLGRTESR